MPGWQYQVDRCVQARFRRNPSFYSADPNVDPTAVKFDELTYDEVLSRHLKATDTTAMTLAMDNHMTLVCFALADPNNILRVVSGEKIGTIVKEDNK